MDTKKLLSEEEWLAMDRKDCRRAVGEDPETGNFMKFFNKYFMNSPKNYENSYEMYCEWYKLENSPLGKALK